MKPCFYYQLRWQFCDYTRTWLNRFYISHVEKSTLPQCEFYVKYNCSIRCQPPYPLRVCANIMSFHMKNKVFLPVRHHKHDFWFMEICIDLHIRFSEPLSTHQRFPNDTHLRKTLQDKVYRKRQFQSIANCNVFIAIKGWGKPEASNGLSRWVI